MKKLLFIPMLALAVFFTSCTDEGNESSSLEESFDINAEETVDTNYEDADEVVNAAVEAQIDQGRVAEDEILEGATVTHDLDNNTITVDFGTGVEGPDGRVRKGVILITYNELRWTPGAFRQVEFLGYSVDDVKLEGTRRKENTSLSEEDNPEFTITMVGGKISFSDSTIITRDVNKVRTWLRANNPINDTISVTGTAEGTRRDGVAYEVEIIEPMIYRRGCRSGRVFVPVAGVKQITAGEDVAIVDYGDGECDNDVTIQINDEEPVTRNLRLRGRRL